jgi:DNA-binding CsgD family transcriptional regulator
MARLRHLVTAADPAGRYGEPEPLPAHGTPQTQLVHRGAELVALSERFYHAIFIAGLGFVSASTIAALAFLPLRASARDAPVPVSTIVAALGVLALAGLATWRAHDVYRLLRRRPQLELVPVLVAALLLSVASPHRNELWWPACAILMVLSLLLSLRRALAYCLLVLAANLTAHVIAGDLHGLSAGDTVGLWVGLPFWVALTVVVPDRMASHILRLNAVRTPPRGRPVAVKAWTTDAAAPAAEGGVKPTEPPAPPEPQSSASSAPDALPRTSAATSAGPHRTAELTSRQLQVVALLADGCRYRVIAACLGISAAQVHRHVTHAVARLGVRSVNELVALAVAEGIVPPRRPSPD